MAIDRIRVSEASTKLVEFDVLDETGAGVPAASLTGARLTLYDIDTYVPGSPTTGILNGREAQSVLNANGVTIDTVGHVEWPMDPDDNVVVNPRRQVERHRAEFHFTWATGEFHQEIEIEVVNLRSVAS